MKSIFLTLCPQPNIVDIEAYIYKNNINFKDSMSTHVQGIFEITDIDKDGLIVFNNKYKVLVTHRNLHRLKVGMKAKGMLHRKIFFVYWEVAYFIKPLEGSL